MLSKTHRLTEEITQALGPLFYEQPDYNIIQQAMGLVLARIAQSTPERGNEHMELEVIHGYAKQALSEFLRIEEERTKVERAVEGFAEFAKEADEAEKAAEEKDLRDYYQDRITLEDMAARKERRRIAAEEAEQSDATWDFSKEETE